MIGKLAAFWRRRSLRFWLTVGTLMTLCPVLSLEVAGYLFNQQVIIRPLVQVSSQQRHVLQPLQSIQLSLWSVSESVNDFMVDDEAGRTAAAAFYEQQAAVIDTAFTNLGAAVKGQVRLAREVDVARNGWQEVADLSHSVLSASPLQQAPDVVEDVNEFEARMAVLSRYLATVYDNLRIENEQTHNQALADLTRWERWAEFGFFASILGAVLAVVLINYSLVTSMDELAAGAMRLAHGDREHHIEVQIPRELANVADAFNLMTNRIRQQEEALARAAKVDGLTGLYNRCEFDRMLEQEIQRGQRYGGSVSLVMGDIDHFKSFNDTHGHQAGDDALRTVAQTLKEDLRTVDKACRFGGEELVLILPECDADAARQAAERLRLAVQAREIRLDEKQTAKVTLSLGVATFPGDGDTPEALVRSADKALYESKEGGRNRVTSATATGSQQSGSSV